MKNDITFYTRFQQDILAGTKTITIRDGSEAHFTPGQRLRTGRYEDNGYFCTLEVLSVTPVTLAQLDEEHARQENMTLAELKKVIADIYPGINELYVIAFKKVEG
ncbi:ASCH domain-containing protein [Cronobacter sakazakii]|uniref:N(4)-acetylcytidine aminohydrolase n=1 Tax=Cronobacter sakazakii TaxID=28141 RepID=UPI000CFAF442|nr:N(4)-acetylcytidine aminohydrolase [Cronobacter sakazakii]EGT4508645.1 ASCH domain-containing protein [Cronobacter sakazakii]EKK5219673.1 ASCH domain-containing protein [Cronobacter sakazakii]ELY3793613.1 ASCH domain-containing protein [Cronobacter sakazakii]ELY3827638.1 ASCH domain-containing protein [Cronobacter sakazakii]ELY4142185.1 ASCH domain-containing protein [Cronobacter sakazakii]